MYVPSPSSTSSSTDARTQYGPPSSIYAPPPLTGYTSPVNVGNSGYPTSYVVPPPDADPQYVVVVSG